MFLELNSKDCIKVQEKQRKVFSHVFTSSTKSEIRHFHVVGAATAKKCTKKHDSRATLLFNQSETIAFFPFSLPSAPSLLKVPHEGLLRLEVGLCKAPYMTQGVFPFFFFFELLEEV